jgi:hypothetical protein
VIDILTLLVIRKKIKEALGAKSKALRDKVVKRMREGLQPSPDTVRIPA